MWRLLILNCIVPESVYYRAYIRLVSQISDACVALAIRLAAADCAPVYLQSASADA
jgi:hypothetical protein